MPNFWRVFDNKIGRAQIGEVVYYEDATFDILTDSEEFMLFINSLTEKNRLPCKEPDQETSAIEIDVDTEMELAALVGQYSEWRYVLEPISEEEIIKHDNESDGDVV